MTITCRTPEPWFIKVRCSLCGCVPDGKPGKQLPIPERDAAEFRRTRWAIADSDSDRRVTAYERRRWHTRVSGMIYAQARIEDDRIDWELHRKCCYSVVASGSFPGETWDAVRPRLNRILYDAIAEKTVRNERT